MGDIFVFIISKFIYNEKEMINKLKFKGKLWQNRSYRPFQSIEKRQF